MALEDILETIRREADEEATRIISAAQARASGLLEQARTESAASEEELAHAADDRIRQMQERITSLAHFDAARERRATREEIFRALLDEVARRLANLRSDERYAAILELLLDEALEILPEPASIRAAAADTGIIGRLASERGLDIAIDAMADSWCGVELVGAGRIVRNDLATRLENANAELRRLAGERFPALRGSSR